MIDRERERDWLTTQLAREGRQLLVIYGRRRVGKTTLVTSVLDTLDAETVYHLCDQRGPKQNATAFATQCAEAFDDVTPAVEGFVEAFQYLADRIDGSCVVALDEFSYLVEADETVPSVFQTIVDDVLAGTEISLVLLGSSISLMEEGVLSYESPLYGRRTGQWELDPLSFADMRAFVPKADIETQIQIYSVLGGMPAYLEQFDPTQGLFDNIEREILSKGAFLYEEPEFLLRQELREPATYLSILEAIAGGATRVTEIAGEIGKDASSLSRYLQNLTKLAVVEQEHPVTDPGGRGLYRITDDFLRFWFRYVAPNRNTLEQGRTRPVREAISETLSTHTSRTFETVCQQAVSTESFPVSCARVGRWWYDEQEIDVVGVDPETTTLLVGECKWTTEPVGMGLLTDLESTATDVRWQDGERTVTYTLFSRQGFQTQLREQAAQRDDLHLYSLADLETLFSTDQE